MSYTFTQHRLVGTANPVSVQQPHPVVLHTTNGPQSARYHPHHPFNSAIGRFSTESYSHQQSETSALSKILPPERSIDLVAPPVHLDFSAIHILINRRHPLRNRQVLLLALLQHLEHQILADRRVVGIAKMLVHALLERFDALPDFLGIIRVCQFLKRRTRVR